MTTQRAADLLGMSRPFFIRLLESGAMAHHRVGNQRRVYLRDELAFAKFHNDLEPARFGPVLVQDRKAPAYERMHRFFSQAIRSAAAPQRFTGMLPRANAWQPTKQYAAH